MLEDIEESLQPGEGSAVYGFQFLYGGDATDKIVLKVEGRQRNLQLAHISAVQMSKCNSRLNASE